MKKIMKEYILDFVQFMISMCGCYLIISSSNWKMFFGILIFMWGNNIMLDRRKRGNE